MREHQILVEAQYTQVMIRKKKELQEVEIERLSFGIILLSSRFAMIECVASPIVL